VKAAKMDNWQNWLKRFFQRNNILKFGWLAFSRNIDGPKFSKTPILEPESPDLADFSITYWLLAI